MISLLLPLLVSACVEPPDYEFKINQSRRLKGPPVIEPN